MSTFSRQQRNRLIGTALVLVIIIFGGSLVYWFLDDNNASVLDCIYMTVITITTIGYGEVVDLTHNPPGRIFTMFLALVGIGTLTYLVSSITALVVEGTVSERFRRRSMEKKAAGFSDHYIVCGVGQVGRHIIAELHATGRQVIVMDTDRKALEKLEESMPDLVYMECDSTDSDALALAGVDRAKGLFAATDEDNLNLIICLTARQLNSAMSIIARCHDLKNEGKMKAAGANRVISPTYIGGLRMASEMVRPAVVSFLDVMMRNSDANLRVEEVTVASGGRTLADLGLDAFTQTLLLAIRQGGAWQYHPPADTVLDDGAILIVMTNPAERKRLQEHLGA